MWQVISIVFYVVMILFVLSCIGWAVRLCFVEWRKMKNEPTIEQLETASHIRMSSVKQLYEI